MNGHDKFGKQLLAPLPNLRCQKQLSPKKLCYLDFFISLYPLGHKSSAQVPLRISFCVETLYFPPTVGSDVIFQLGWVNSEYCQTMSDCGSEMTY